MWIFSRGSQSQIGIIACVIQRFSCKPHKWCVIVPIRDNKKQQEKVKRSGWDGGRNVGTTVKPGFSWSLQSLSAAISATLCWLWSLSHWPLTSLKGQSLTLQLFFMLINFSDALASPPTPPHTTFTAFRICHKIKSPFRLLINSTHRRCLLPRKPLTTAQVTGPSR